jgi:hypothetical protein
VRNTDAYRDTGTAIRSNLDNHKVLRQKMIGIDSRYRDLKKNIADYQHLNDYMSSDARYDQNGNLLLYLRKEPPPPSLVQLNAQDTQFLSNQQTLVFYTGLITAATLIVLAVTMGSSG